MQYPYLVSTNGAPEALSQQMHDNVCDGNGTAQKFLVGEYVQNDFTISVLAISANRCEFCTSTAEKSCRGIVAGYKFTNHRRIFNNCENLLTSSKRFLSSMSAKRAMFSTVNLVWFGLVRADI